LFQIKIRHKIGDSPILKNVPFLFKTLAFLDYYGGQMNLWKIYLFIAILSGCTSSGLEPNWDAANNPSTSTRPFAKRSASTNFRVELRKIGGDQRQSNNIDGDVTIVKNGRRVNARPSFSSNSRQTLSRSSHSSYVLAQPGYPANLLYDEQTIVFTLGRPRGEHIQVAFGHASPTNTLNTSVSVPLGGWYPIGSIGGLENDGSSSSRLGASSSMGRERSSRNNQTSYEIRITPL